MFCLVVTQQHQCYLWLTYLFLHTSVFFAELPPSPTSPWIRLLPGSCIILNFEISSLAIPSSSLMQRILFLHAYYVPGWIYSREQNRQISCLPRTYFPHFLKTLISRSFCLRKIVRCPNNDPWSMGEGGPGPLENIPALIHMSNVCNKIQQKQLLIQR